MEALKSYVETLPHVVAVDINLTMCTTAGAAFIAKYVKDYNANRVVVAA
jgi:heterodisulfide reductase subunit A-like polyferredoxin